MKAISDRALKRTAWVVASFVPAMTVVGATVTLAEPTAGNSWGDFVGELAFLVVVATFPLVGLLILRRQPRNRVGWLLQGVGFLWGLSMLADIYATYGLLVDPGSLPGADVVEGLAQGSWAPGIGLMGTFLILLYPDGHLPTPRWRAVAWLSAVTIVVVTTTIALLPGRMDESAVPDMRNPIGLEGAAPVLDVVLAVFLPLLPLCILASAVSLVRRFRRAHGVERLQLKWLATAGAVVAGLYLLTMAGSFLTATTAFAGGSPLWVTTLQTVSILSFALLPVAIGIAVLRHGLYGIDVVINRTLVYGSLTVTLAGVYVGSVLLLQLVLSPVTSQSDLAVAGSTLVVAALFRPARTRIQSAVDRRFYRSRYDAARTLEAFTSRLRHELDLDAVGNDLRTTVDKTVQPAHLSLWLRP